ncbi:MAG: polyprenol monophosphomannose synthase [Candidatus Dormibacteria bacterium]
MLVDESAELAEACDLSVVIPTRNEADNLPALHRELRKRLEGINYEVVVVDDSTDEATRPILRQIVAGDGRWRVAEREAAEQRGLGTAVTLGLGMAHGDAVCVMDADLQHPPSAIPRLLAAIHGGADLAVGARYTAGGSAVGLSSPYRKAVSRGISWAAQAIFPETRRTTDPLSGFFCVRREAITGLEFRPIGFKILLELLVCLPRIQVRDVPFTFGPRFSGSSKASLGQGLQFGMHLLSLFVYVPLAGLLSKIAFSAGAGMVVFVLSIAVLKAVAVHGALPWLLASTASLAVSVAAYGLMTFRTAFWRIGLSGQRLLWAIGLSCVAGGIISFAILAEKARLATILVAVLAQCVALVAGYGLARYVQVRERRATPLPSLAEELSLHALAERLGAQRAWWAETLGVSATGRLEKLVTPDILSHVTRSGQPLLTVELPSCRPQARVNVDSLSLMLIPHFGQGRRVVRVAVLVRGGRSPFSTRDLHVALEWFSRRQGPGTLPVPGGDAQAAMEKSRAS